MPDHELTKLPKPTLSVLAGEATDPYVSPGLPDSSPRFRWLVIEADGRRREVCFSPEMARPSWRPATQVRDYWRCPILPNPEVGDEGSRPLITPVLTRACPG